MAGRGGIAGSIEEDIEGTMMDSIESNKKIFQESFYKYGDDPRSCLWNSNVDFRYEELNRIADLNGASVLEVGCGIGGFYDFCINGMGIKNFRYKGVDLVPGMIELARKKYPSAEWEVCNILEKERGKEQRFDYVILGSIFNVSTQTWEMKEILAKAFLYCRKGMAFNFISSYVNYKDDAMSYHNPQEIFSFCVENLSRKVNMNHHYAKCDVSVFVYRE